MCVVLISDRFVSVLSFLVLCSLFLFTVSPSVSFLFFSVSFSSQHVSHHRCAAALLRPKVRKEKPAEEEQEEEEPEEGGRLHKSSCQEPTTARGGAPETSTKCPVRVAARTTVPHAAAVAVVVVPVVAVVVVVVVVVGVLARGGVSTMVCWTWRVKGRRIPLRWNNGRRPSTTTRPRRLTRTRCCNNARLLSARAAGTRRSKVCRNPEMAGCPMGKRRCCKWKRSTRGRRKVRAGTTNGGSIVTIYKN